MLHQFFATFVAMVFSFCHHNAGLRPAADFVAPVAQYTVQSAGPILTFPARQELAQSVPVSGYAETACSSCQMTTPSYTVR